MGFSDTVAARALVASGRCCCICHKFCGTKIELHHIKQRAYDGEDTFENCIPLCFDCHEDMGKADPKHPKGKRYTETELIMHRDNWYKRNEGNILAGSDKIYEEDKRLFAEICEVFSGSMEYKLRELDLSGMHVRRSYEKIDELCYKFKSPFNEFINVELEKLRGSLWEKMDLFINCLVTTTFPIGKDCPDHNATHLWLMDNGYIPRGDKDHEKFREKMIDQFNEEAKNLNDSATELWECYCEFVRQGRRLLG